MWSRNGVEIDEFALGVSVEEPLTRTKMGWGNGGEEGLGRSVEMGGNAEKFAFYPVGVSPAGSDMVRFSVPMGLGGQRAGRSRESHGGNGKGQ